MVGLVFVVLRLMPGPLAGLRNEMQNFRNALLSLPRRELSPDVRNGRLPGQIWLAVAGGASMIVGLRALIR